MTGKDKLLVEALTAVRKAAYEGIVLIGTGGGKGKLMVEVAKELNPKTILYLCSSELLRDVTFKDELIKWDAAYLIPRIDFQCYQTARTWVGKQYDLLLADEFDFALTPEYIKGITNNKYDKRILVSATLDDAKLRMAKKIAPIIFERKSAELIETKVLNKVRFYFVNYNLTVQENAAYLAFNMRFKKLLNQFKTKQVEEQLEELQIQRKQWLSKLNSSMDVTKWLVANLQRKNNDKILIFCGLSEQADRICKHSYHSNNDEAWLLDAFDKGTIRMMAVVNKIDRGLNIDDIRNIIHESIGKSKTRLTQRTGRGMRLDPNDTLNVFFQVPYYKDKWGRRKATTVLNWIIESAKDMDLTNAQTIEYKL